MILDNEIKSVFTEKYNITITDKHVKAIERSVIVFEVTGNAPEVLNSPLLGVQKIYFTDKMIASLFNIFNIDYASFKKTVQSISAINKEFHVISDPYNLLTMWLVYCVGKSKLSDKNKYQLQFNLLKLLHYKFFTSAVNRLLPHGANAEIMQTVIEFKLGQNFDISKYGTWKKVIEQSCTDILSSTSPHVETIKHFVGDKEVLYLISDTQTKLRNRLVRIIIKEYYPLKDKEDAAIRSYEVVGNIDGQKVLKDSSNALNTIISSIINQMYNQHQFIDSDLIQRITKPNQNIRAELFKIFLIKFCDKAIDEKNSDKLDEEKSCDLGMMPVGARILISKLIRETYRQCMFAKIDMTSKIEILQKTRNLFTSSRVLDPEILMIKRSITDFIMNCGETKRDATVSAARLCFIVYIIVLSFKYLK